MGVLSSDDKHLSQNDNHDKTDYALDVPRLLAMVDAAQVLIRNVEVASTWLRHTDAFDTAKAIIPIDRVIDVDDED